MSFSCECGKPIPKIALDYALEGKLIRCSKCGVSLKLAFKNAAPFMPMSTITDAREHLHKNLEKGLPCPVCARFCKMYKRRFHSEMGLFLIRLVKFFRETDAWVHTRTINPGTAKSSSDGSYLTLWGLIERKPVSVGSKSAGLYKPAQEGIRLVDGLIQAPDHAFVFNNKVLGFSEKTVTIQEILGTKFDYDELMAA
jgi:hypothetical protein